MVPELRTEQGALSQGGPLGADPARPAYLTLPQETEDHAHDETEPVHIENQQYQQEHIKVIVAEEGARVLDGVKQSRVDDPKAGNKKEFHQSVWLPILGTCMDHLCS